MAKRVIREIISQEEISPGYFRMVIDAPDIAEDAKAGQFLHLKWTSEVGSNDPLLRRPISINRIDKSNGEITIIYRLLGRGTEILSRLKAGDKLDIMGSLGNGFSIPEEDKFLFVGGGMGIAPLLPLVEKLKALDKEVIILLGTETKDELLNLNDYRQMGVEVKVATIDGSYGHQGFVTDLLDELEDIDYLYTCGPEVMMKKVQDWAVENGLVGQASLEERMGCGTGACLSCVCKIKVGDDSNWEYKKTCTDGPIFSLTEVIFDE